MYPDMLTSCVLSLDRGDNIVNDTGSILKIDTNKRP